MYIIAQFDMTPASNHEVHISTRVAQFIFMYMCCVYKYVLESDVYNCFELAVYLQNDTSLLKVTFVTYATVDTS